VLDIFIVVALGIATLVTAYLGVHVTLHPAESQKEKQFYKIGFVVCGVLISFLAGWQAYRNNKTQNELSQELGRIEKNTNEPPKVQVNVPPAQVVVEPSEAHMPPSYLEVSNIIPPQGFNIIAPNKQFGLNVEFTQVGNGPIEDIHNVERILVGNEKSESSLKSHFSELLNEAIRQDGGRKSALSLLNGRFYNSAVSPVLTEDQAKEILDGHQFFYLFIWATWKDQNGSKGKLEQCSWIMKPPEEFQVGQTISLHSCNP
jgi:hypothetical protein